MAVLCLTRCFRPDTMALLRADQFTLKPHRRVNAKVYAWQLKNGQEEDMTLVLNGELTDCDWMNELIWLYLVEARPGTNRWRRASRPPGCRLLSDCRLHPAARANPAAGWRSRWTRN